MTLKESLFSQTTGVTDSTKFLQSSFQERRNKFLEREPGQKSDDFKLTPSRIKALFQERTPTAQVQIYNNASTTQPVTKNKYLISSADNQDDEFTFYG